MNNRCCSSRSSTARLPTTALLSALERTHVTCGLYCGTGVEGIQRSFSAALELGQSKECEN